MADTIAKNQHYVPRFILKRFTTDEKEQIWVYDKLEKKKFQTNIKNIASETGFYNIKIENSTFSVEPALGQIEDLNANIIKKIIDCESIGTLTEKEKYYLSFFVVLQLVRGKHYRNLLVDMVKGVNEAAKQKGWNTGEAPLMPEPSEEEVKIHGIRSVLTCDKYVPYILNKKWLLFKTTKNNPLYISDNPVTLHNYLNRGPGGSLGLAVKGVEIYFPLSSSLCLTFFCPLNVDPIINGSKRLIEKMGSGTNIYVKEWMEGIEKGSTITLIPPTLLFQKSSQVIFSSRFVYCEVDDFSLVEEMLKQHPDLAQRPTVEVV